MRLCAICGKPTKSGKDHLCPSCYDFICKMQEREKENDEQRSRKITYYNRRESY